MLFIGLISAAVPFLPVVHAAENGQKPVSEWVLDSNGHWYHYDSNGEMNIGWYQDANGDWYYLSPADDGTRGIMHTGWLIDNQDNNWYYLIPESGRMATGWIEIDGHFYYFNEGGSEMSGWRWDPETNCWIYNERGQRPLGMLEGGY